jgi:hypothetical protein
MTANIASWHMDDSAGSSCRLMHLRHTAALQLLAHGAAAAAAAGAADGLCPDSVALLPALLLSIHQPLPPAGLPAAS